MDLAKSVFEVAVSQRPGQVSERPRERAGGGGPDPLSSWVTTHRKDFTGMAHHEDQPTAIESVLELLSEHGLGAMAEAMQTLLSEAMKLERSEFLRAAPGERTDERTAYANGFEPKALKNRVGELETRIAEVERSLEAMARVVWAVWRREQGFAASSAKGAA